MPLIAGRMGAGSSGVTGRRVSQVGREDGGSILGGALLERPMILCPRGGDGGTWVARKVVFTFCPPAHCQTAFKPLLCLSWGWHLPHGPAPHSAPFPSSHRPAAFPARSQVHPAYRQTPSRPSQCPLRPVLSSALRTFPASSDPGALTPPCLCTCCSRHPAPPWAQTQSSPFGKASLGTPASSPLGPTSFRASPRPRTKACANAPGIGPGTWC